MALAFLGASPRLRAATATTTRGGCRVVAAATAVLLTLGAASIAGCTSSPFEAPSEYTKQHVLCGPEDAVTWAALIEECGAAFRRDRSCVGYVDFRGTLQGQEIAVHTKLYRTVVSEAASPTDTPYLAGFTSDGIGPYFAFEFELKQLGGPSNVAIPEERTLVLAEAPVSKDQTYVDDRAELALRLAVGGEAENFRAQSGDVTFTVPAPYSLQGTFQGNFRGNGNGKLEGCFAVFGTKPGTTP